MLLILAWRLASVIGFEGLLFRGCGAVRRALHRDSADSNGTVQVAQRALMASTSNPSAEAYLREPRAQITATLDLLGGCDYSEGVM